jgi:hypothetical protein
MKGAPMFRNSRDARGNIIYDPAKNKPKFYFRISVAQFFGNEMGELATNYASTPWRLQTTLPRVGRAMRRFGRGSWAWVTLNPSSWPRRTVRSMLLRTLRFVLARPNLTRIARQPFERFPLLKSVKRRVFAILLAKNTVPPSDSIFSERERFVHASLEAALERRAN